MADLVTKPAVLVSHLGYNSRVGGTAIVVAPTEAAIGAAGAVSHEASSDSRDDVAVSSSTEHRIRLAVDEPQTVEGWGPTVYRRVDLAPLAEAVASGAGGSTPAGSAGETAVGGATGGGARSFVVVVDIDGEQVSSVPFVVGDHQLQSTIADVTAYFRSQRSSGEIDRKDAAAGFFSDEPGPGARTIDARGGWLDASGDTSKFLSHLTYTGMMSPQQIPLCAWALLRATAELDVGHADWRSSQRARVRDEGLFGADFLVRFQDPSGFFYTGIFDALTKRLDERVITAPLQNSVRTTRWQAGYRHGGGLAIAALALAATADDEGEFSRDRYFEAAERGFHHLEEHGTEYLFDGHESVIDDYCALLAATELTAAARSRGSVDEPFVEAAVRRARSLRQRLATDENGAAYLVGDIEGRPFFHAAESGLPVVALLRFADVVGAAAAGAAAASAAAASAAAASAAAASAAAASAAAASAAADAEQTALTILEGTLRRTDSPTDTTANPFGLPRQRVEPTGRPPRDSFFFPHDNETGYWWQGENAQLASVAFAATIAARRDATGDAMRERLVRLAGDSVSWILGLNPFDACMLQGRGHGAPEYSGEYQNSPGGIVNGITSGFVDEGGIAFDPRDAPPGEEWRWAEQWIPHSGWFVLAVAALP